MPIVLIPFVLGLLYILERKIFNRFWQRGLSASLSFETEAATEGEEALLTEVITNRNFIPLHILQVNFQTDVGLEFMDTTNASVTDRVNVIDVFSLRFYEKITRDLRIMCKKRGFYSILQTSLVASDLFSPDIHYATRDQNTFFYVYPRLLQHDNIDMAFEHLQGEAQAQRFLYEDNFTFRGIRDYAPTDQMSSINWKASARTGSLKVNLHDYTVSPEVKIVLNVEEPGILFETELIEDCIRLSATMAARFALSNVPVSLLTNGKDKVTSEKVCIEAGASADHLQNIMRALARIDLTKGTEDIDELVNTEVENGGLSQVIFLYISTSRREKAIQAAEKLAEAKGELIWMCPLTKSMDDTAPSDGRIEFVRILHQ